MPHDFRCAVCGKSACYGKGVSLAKGVVGTWFCAVHVPVGLLPSRGEVAPSRAGSQAAAQGKLL